MATPEVKPKRGEKVRCGNTWTESKYWQFIRSALRRAFTRYPPKYAVKAAAKRVKPTSRVGKHKYEYQCGTCKEWFKDKGIEVNHIIPCGSLKCSDDVQGFVERMFCEADGLAVICKACHKEETARQREERKNT